MKTKTTRVFNSEAEYVSYSEDEVKRLEIREMCETDPAKRAEIRKEKHARAKLLEKLKDHFKRSMYTADMKF